MKREDARPLAAQELEGGPVLDQGVVVGVEERSAIRRGDLRCIENRQVGQVPDRGPFQVARHVGPAGEEFRRSRCEREGPVRGEKEEVGTFTKEPPRSSLTTPPVGYRTPSGAQPYGISKSTPRPTVTPLDPAVGSIGR